MSLLEIQNVSRSFGAVQALRGVDITLHAGQVHALMGENGAGKSTLIRILAGVDRPDSGEIAVDGAPVAAGQPWQVRAAGMRFIHQELHPVRGLSVAENMFLDHPYPKRAGLVNWSKLNRRAREALGKLDLAHIDPRAPMTALAAGDQMLVRIAATLIHDEHEAKPWLYVMDEPTAALTGAEADRLFAVIKNLVGQGCGVLYVSHRMPEVLALSDTITVLRDGEHISTRLRRHTDQDRIIHDMTGRDLSGLFPPRVKALEKAKPILKVTHLRAGPLRDVSLELRPGEVLGIGGLAGSGRGALLRAILGDLPRKGGTVMLDGKRLARRPSRVWKQGVAYIPRERRSEGLMLGRSITENVALPHLGPFSLGGVVLNPFRQKRTATEQGEKVRLKSASLRQPCHELSGGNQQKVLFARALAGNPKVLLLDEPTRGVDIGARFDLYRIIRSLSEDGLSVIITSSDLPELIGLSDRIAILQNGRITGHMVTENLTEAALLARFYDVPEQSEAA